MADNPGHAWLWREEGGVSFVLIFARYLIRLRHSLTLILHMFWRMILSIH